MESLCLHVAQRKGARCIFILNRFEILCYLRLNVARHDILSVRGMGCPPISRRFLFSSRDRFASTKAIRLDPALEAQSKDTLFLEG